MAMKVGIDLSNLHKFSKKRGIGFYAENLINSLKKYTDTDVLVIKDKNSNQKVDLIHYPYLDFFRPTLPLIKKYPTVVTIHDVIPLKFSEHYPPGLKGRLKHFIQRLALTDVKKIITDSDASKNDVNAILKIKRDKIISIPLAPAEHFKKINNKDDLEKVRKKYKLPESFALYVGSVNWNKNLSSLAKACIKADLDLVLVGGDFVKKENLNHPELASFKNFLEEFYGNPKIHLPGFVENKELVSIYNLAAVTLLVSYYEGFGLSILESQACGTPVITSNISSMPEVAGNGAVLVNPNNIDEISRAFREVLENKILRENLIKRGRKNVRKFFWEKTAEETSQVYSNILNNA